MYLRVNQFLFTSKLLLALFHVLARAGWSLRQTRFSSGSSLWPRDTFTSICFRDPRAIPVSEPNVLQSGSVQSCTYTVLKIAIYFSHILAILFGCICIDECLRWKVR